MKKMNTAALALSGLLAITLGLSACGAPTPEPQEQTSTEQSQTSTNENATENDGTAAEQSESSTTTESTGDTSTQQETSSQQTTADAAYIGEDAAKEAALKHAGLAEKDCTHMRVQLDAYDNDDPAHYEIGFIADETEYDYDIDAYDGKVLAFEFESIYDD